MAEYKSHRIKIENLSKGKVLYTKDNRNRVLNYTLWIIAVLSLFVLPNRYYSIPLIVIAIIVSLKKDKIFYQGCDNMFIMYNDRENIYCDVIYLSEICKWEYRVKNSGDNLLIALSDEEVIKIAEQCEIGLYHYFQKVLPEKEYRHKKN